MIPDLSHLDGKKTRFEEEGENELVKIGLLMRRGNHYRFSHRSLLLLSIRLSKGLMRLDKTISITKVKIFIEYHQLFFDYGMKINNKYRMNVLSRIIKNFYLNEL